MQSIAITSYKWNWASLTGMTEDDQKALFSLCSLKQNNFKKYDKKAKKKNKLKEMLLEPNYILE